MVYIQNYKMITSGIVMTTTPNHMENIPNYKKPRQFTRRQLLPVGLLSSREVLHVALLFLRVISACADGKIRIYNFLNGNCLKVMKANGRGDPVLSFFIQGNRWVVGVEVGAVSNSVWMIFFLLWETSPGFAGSRKELVKLGPLPILASRE